MIFRFILARAIREGNFATLGRFAAAFLDNCRVFVSGGEARKGPVSMVWDVTDRCNLQCAFCGWGRTPAPADAPRRKELGRDEKLSIVRKLGDAGVWLVSFCGGEPLLCRDLGALIAACKARGMAVGVSTNGLLLEESAGMLVDAGVDSITVSVDGPDAEALDRMRGHAGLCAKIERGIAEVRRLSRKRPVRIEARCLINKLNAHALESLVARWGPSLDAVMFKPIYENPHVFYRVPDRMRLGQEDEADFREHFRAFLKKHKAYDSRYNRLIPDFLFAPGTLKDKYLCFAGLFFAGIGCDGSLYACHELTMQRNEPLGDLAKDDFMGLWNSPGLRALRKRFKQGERCDCWMDRFEPGIGLQRLLTPINDLCRMFSHDKTT